MNLSVQEILKSIKAGEALDENELFDADDNDGDNDGDNDDDNDDENDDNDDNDDDNDDSSNNINEIIPKVC